MDQGIQPKKTSAKRGRPFQNGLEKKRSSRKPKVPVATKTTVQRPTRVKVQPGYYESDSDEQTDEMDQQPVLKKSLFPSFLPFEALNLNGPTDVRFPRSDTLEYRKLKSCISEYLRDEISKEKDNKQSSIHLRPDLASIDKLAGGLNNAKCDKDDVQAIRRKEDGTVEYLYNWYAKDEEKTNKKLVDDIKSPSKYFNTDVNNNTNDTNNLTSSISPSPSVSPGTSSSADTNLRLPITSNNIVDLTNVDDFPEQGFFITKFIKNEGPNRKMKTPKRNNNPEDVTVIELD